MLCSVRNLARGSFQRYEACDVGALLVQIVRSCRQELLETCCDISSVHQYLQSCVGDTITAASLPAILASATELMTALPPHKLGSDLALKREIALLDTCVDTSASCFWLWGCFHVLPAVGEVCLLSVCVWIVLFGSTWSWCVVVACPRVSCCALRLLPCIGSRLGVFEYPFDWMSGAAVGKRGTVVKGRHRLLTRLLPCKSAGMRWLAYQLSRAPSAAFVLGASMLLSMGVFTLLALLAFWTGTLDAVWALVVPLFSAARRSSALCAKLVADAADVLLPAGIQALLLKPFS